MNAKADSNFATALVPNADRAAPVISLFMKTDFLFVGNLLCIIWEICFILFGQICLSQGFASEWRTRDHQRRSLSIHAAHDDDDNDVIFQKGISHILVHFSGIVIRISINSGPNF